MANPELGEVAFPAVDVIGFEEGGILVLDFNALCTLEGEVSQKITSIGADVLQSPSMMRTVFRIALEARHGQVSERDAGEIIQRIGPARAGELVAEAFLLSFPPAEGGTSDGNPPKPGANGTGKSASANGSRSGTARKASGAKHPASGRKS